MYTALKMSFTGLSLILFFIGSDGLPLQKRSDSSQQPAWCRDHRPKSSLASPCNEDQKVRRFFLHESNPKGCKKFGICPNDAAKYDDLAENNYFRSFEDCQRECMEHVLCPELPIGENMAVVSDNALQGWGRRVVFECNNGYGLSDNTDRRIRTCQKNGTWSGVAPVCLKQCEAPSTIRHANIAPSKQLHSQGGTIHYTCEVGYELNGSAERTCGANGVWIQEEPSCRCQSQASETDECTRCPEPSPIEHGHLLAINHSLFAEIEYTCDPSYNMFGSPTRVCRENGQWSGEQPTCWNVEIRMSQDGGEATDVTDQVVELAMGSTNIEFTAIVSTPNPFEGTKPVWTFNEQDGLPFAIDQSGYSLTFNSILQSKEQHGNYSVSLGNLSTSFRLHVKAVNELPEPSFKLPKLVILNNMTISNVAEFLCIVEGSPIPRLEWYHNDELLTSGGRTVVSSPSQKMELAISILIISNITESDSGSYWCRAENEGGNNSWRAELNLARTVQKRSIEDSAKPLLCNLESSNTVTLLGRVKAQVGHTRNSDSMPSYRVQVKRFLRGSDAESSTHRVRVVVVDEPRTGEEQRLRIDTDYILQGRLIEKTLFVSRHRVYRHTMELESHIESWASGC